MLLLSSLFTRRKQLTLSSRPSSTIALLCLPLVIMMISTDAATLAAAASSPPCTVCVNGQDNVYINISKAFSVHGLAVQTCVDLVSTAGVFTLDEPICRKVQAVSTYCGCPLPFDSACRLCKNASMKHPLLQLDNYNASEYVYGALDGVKLNCETLDAVLNVIADDTDDSCRQTRDDVGFTCGCPYVDEIVVNITTANNTSNNKTTTPPETGRSEPCNLCWDGTSTPIYTDRLLHLGSSLSFVQNCHDLATFSSLLTAKNELCQNLQPWGPYCGCPVPTGACSFCPNGEASPYPYRYAPFLVDFNGLPPGVPTLARQGAANITCGEFESILALPPPGSIEGVDPHLLCLVSQLRSGSCGCSQGWLAKLITWLYRVSAILSLVGSCYILKDIIEKPVERQTTYHQLVFGMTFFDIITSVAYLLAGVLLPPYSGQYQAYGNHATCLLQGFIIQLGETSLFYNILLCVYFLLLVKYNWKERRFRQCRIYYFHLPILAIGIGLAGGSLPFIVPQLAVCYVGVPPQSVNRIPISIFFALPNGLALCVMFMSSLAMCHHVYRTERTSTRYSIMKRNLALTKKVCWQSIFYCGIFTITLPFLTFSFYADFKGRGGALSNFLLSAILAPSQGFLNSLIYFQRGSHSFQWVRSLLWRQQPAKEQHQQAHHVSFGDHSLDGHSHRRPSHGTGESIVSNVKNPNEMDLAPPDSNNEEDDPFSAPALHWINEELPNK